MLHFGKPSKLLCEQRCVQMSMKTQRFAFPVPVNLKIYINTLKGIFLLNKNHEVSFLLNGYLAEIKMSSELCKFWLRTFLIYNRTQTLPCLSMWDLSV